MGRGCHPIRSSGSSVEKTSLTRKGLTNLRCSKGCRQLPGQAKAKEMETGKKICVSVATKHDIGRISRRLRGQAFCSLKTARWGRYLQLTHNPLHVVLRGRAWGFSLLLPKANAVPNCVLLDTRFIHSLPSRHPPYRDDLISRD